MRYASSSTISQTDAIVSDARRSSSAAVRIAATRCSKLIFSLIGVFGWLIISTCSRSAAPKDGREASSRLGEQSQGLSLDGEPRLLKWRQERSGAPVSDG